MVGPKEPEARPSGRLGGARVVDHVILEVLGQILPGIEALLELGVRDVAGHDQRAREREAGRDRVPRELGAGSRASGRRRSMRTTSPASCSGRRSGRKRAGFVLELLEEDALARDLRQDLAIRGARDAEPDRARRAVARQPDHAHVVREVLAAELGADPGLVAQALDLLLERGIAEGAAVLVAGASAGRRDSARSRASRS